MSDLPNDLLYTKSHEWIRNEGDNIVAVGITDHAQHQLGDLVFVELPELDEDVEAGDEIAVVESVKTAADVYAPVGGKIVEINERLNGAPEKVNQDAFGDGWLFRIEMTDPGELDDLLSAEQYLQEIEEE